MIRTYLNDPKDIYIDMMRAAMFEILDLKEEEPWQTDRQFISHVLEVAREALYDDDGEILPVPGLDHD